MKTNAFISTAALYFLDSNNSVLASPDKRLGKYKGRKD